MTNIEKRELLSRLFIFGHYPYSKWVLGDLKKEYGVELIEIYRNPFAAIKHKPDNGNSWLGPRSPLSWGSSTGWNITEDCKISS